MAKSVQDFWPRVSFGYLGYDMSRSQSIMRIATTASPVSGSDVREKMIELGEETTKLRTIIALQRAFRWAARARTRSSSKEKVVTEAEIEKLRLMREQRERAERLAAEASQKAIGGFDPLGRTASMGSIPLDGDGQVGGVRPPPAAAADAAPPKPSMKQKQKRRPSGASPQQKQRAAEMRRGRDSSSCPARVAASAASCGRPASVGDASTGSRPHRSLPTARRVLQLRAFFVQEVTASSSSSAYRQLAMRALQARSLRFGFAGGGGSRTAVRRRNAIGVNVSARFVRMTQST